MLQTTAATGHSELDVQLLAKDALAPSDGPHPHNHHHHRPLPSAHASDDSTPSRTRSTSSSNFTPLSTFPSSTSRPQAHSERDKVHVKVTAADHNADAGASDDHDVPFAQLNHYYRHYPAAHAPQPPHSLLASPPLCLRGHLRRGGKSAASRCSRSQSRSRRPSQEEDRNSGVSAGAEQDIDSSADPSRAITTGAVHDDDEGRGASNNDDGNIVDNVDDDEDDEAQSLDSQTLAWDQTCLRIAYLVSTMVTPSANVSVGGDVEGLPSTSAAAAAALSSSSLDNAVARQLSPPMLEHCVDKCPRGWPGVEVWKKRRKVAQTLRWQGEIADCGKAVYCGCGDSCATPYSEEPPDDAAAAAADFDDGPGADVTSESPAICEWCRCPLTPERPIVWVAHPADKGSDAFKSPDGGSAGDSLRKVFKSFRGLVFSSKKKRSASLPSPATAANTATSTQQDCGKKTTARRAWDQWDEINCSRLRQAGDDSLQQFFPTTAMYHVQTEDADEQRAARAGAAPETAAAGAAAEGPAGAAAAARAAESPSLHSLTTEDEYAQSRVYDPVAVERRRKREMEARLQRAQELLYAGARA